MPVRRKALETGATVYLRDPSARDREEMIERARASRRLHGSWVSPPSSGESYADWLDRMRQPTARSFLVCRNEDDAIVGVYTLSQRFRKGFQSAYMGYYAFEPFAGQGYMGEGMQLVLLHIFKTLKLHRVEANIQPGNDRSTELARKSGFRREGFSPRYLKIAGRWRDHERWAITAEDWRPKHKG
ncbi:MAG TPA: GNAT family N-acetyltransferase [Candidatus Dormibacteraeota bacterium]|nr:GNAT family N-acetyltransferase [Candidatus Dormibacteraeota bacterium]